MTGPRVRREWEEGWSGHADAQARRVAALSLAEKLDWLEEAHARVLHMQGRSNPPLQVREGGPAADPPDPTTPGNPA